MDTNSTGMCWDGTLCFEECKDLGHLGSSRTMLVLDIISKGSATALQLSFVQFYSPPHGV